MTDAELFMAMRAAFRDAEKFVEASADRIEAQAAEIERLRGELAKAVEALEAFKEFDDAPVAVKRPDLFEIKVRRTILRTLAELTGVKP